MIKHWTEQYIGREYVRGEYDCASLVVDVQREVFGRDVPDFGERPGRRSDEMEMIAEMLDEAEELVERVEEPEEGCAVQIKVSMNLTHVGTYCEINGEGYVLHNIKKHGVIATKVRDLWRHGWVVEGYYRWI